MTHSNSPERAGSGSFPAETGRAASAVRPASVPERFGYLPEQASDRLLREAAQADPLARTLISIRETTRPLSCPPSHTDVLYRATVSDRSVITTHYECAECHAQWTETRWQS